MSDTIFHATGISKAFAVNSRIEVLKELEIEVKRGEIISVVGASGTGKTTLLHILGTLERPTSGHLYYEGTDVFTRSSTALAHFRNKTIGFVFQFHHLLPEFTALENIMLPGLIAGMNKKQVQEEAEQLLARVGLAERAAHKIGELSGGEQQRIAIARALIMKPAILLADEPTGNLDPQTGSKVYDLLEEMHAHFSIATVMVTHNMDLAGRAHRCLTLRDGRLHS